MLTGEVRLYEQKLITDRVAWTMEGVLEVENEIRGQYTFLKAIQSEVKIGILPPELPGRL